jgi:hypothetical protein
MGDNDSFGFGKFVPGFDFLQNLAKGASQTLPQMPNLSNWVAPTLNLEELEKRIGELKAVHFWLDQNSKALGATIQALEVQKMTLSTLKTMNVQMGDLRESLKLKPMGEAASAPAAKKVASRAPQAAPTPGGVVDPMQWWGALTNQFAELATSAMKDSAADATKALAGNLMKQSFDAAAETMKKVAGAPGRAVADAKSPAPKAGGGTAAKKAAKRPASGRRRRSAPVAT